MRGVDLTDVDLDELRNLGSRLDKVDLAGAKLPTIHPDVFLDDTAWA
jgi:hypothetical protein